MRKAKVLGSVIAMFTVGFLWYIYLTSEMVVHNWLRERRRRRAKG